MDAQRFWLMVLGAAWLIAWAASAAALWMVAPEGDGTVQGHNGVMAFLGWQAIASMLAFVIWQIGRGWPERSAVRQLSRMPIALAGLLVLAIGAAFLWVRG